MLARLSEEAFDDKNWVFEIKWDGYRAIADLSRDTPLYSRNGISFIPKFDKIAQDFKQQKHQMILDGEVVAYDDQGNPIFNFYSKSGTIPILLSFIRFLTCSG